MKKSKVALILGAGIVGGGALVAVPVLATLLSQANDKGQTPSNPVSPIVPPIAPPRTNVKNEVTPAQAQVLIDGINKFVAQAQERLSFVIPTEQNLALRTQLQNAITEAGTLNTSIKEVEKFTKVEKDLLAALEGIKDAETYNSKLTEITNQLAIDTTNPTGKYYITPEANVTVGGDKPTVYDTLSQKVVSNRVLLNTKGVTADQLKEAITQTESLIQNADTTYNSIKENWYSVNADVLGNLLKASTNEKLSAETRQLAEEAVNALTQGLELKPIISQYNDNVARSVANAKTIFAQAATNASSSISALEVYNRTQAAANAYLNVLKEEYKLKVNALDSLLDSDKQAYIKQMDALPSNDQLQNELEKIYQQAVAANEARKTLIAPLVAEIAKAEAAISEQGKLYVAPADENDSKLNAENQKVVAAIATAKGLLANTLTEEQVKDGTKTLSAALDSAVKATNENIKTMFITPAKDAVFGMWKDESYTPTTADADLEGLKQAALTALTTYLNNANLEAVKAEVVKPADTMPAVADQTQAFETAMVTAYADVNISKAKANFDALQSTANAYLTRANQDKAIDKINALADLTDEEKAGFITQVRAVEGFLTNTNFKTDVDKVVEEATKQDTYNKNAKPLIEAINKANELFTNPTGALYFSDGLVQLLAQPPLSTTNVTSVVNALKTLINDEQTKSKTYTMENEFTTAAKKVNDKVTETLQLVNDNIYPAYMLSVAAEAFNSVKELLVNIDKTDSGLTADQVSSIKDKLNEALLAVFAPNGDNATPEALNTIEKIVAVVKGVGFTTTKVPTLSDDEIKAGLMALGETNPTETMIKAIKDQASKGIIEPNDVFKNQIQSPMVNELKLTLNDSYERVTALRASYGQEQLEYLKAQTINKINALTMPAEWKAPLIAKANAITEYNLMQYGKTEAQFDAIYNEAQAEQARYDAKTKYEAALAYANSANLLDLYAKLNKTASATYATELESAKVKSETPTKDDYDTATTAIVTAQVKMNEAAITAVNSLIETQKSSIANTKSAITKIETDGNRTGNEGVLKDNKTALENLKAALQSLEAELATLNEVKTKLGTAQPAAVVAPAESGGAATSPATSPSSTSTSTMSTSSTSAPTPAAAPAADASSSSSVSS
ncbi:hypothetical protein GE118_03820 [Mycoplasma sp. NEAQ87857]|uniref:hypothetical protein n=1 Tax=Mycoplasma sp. NEAQ87857 TaxID=2683967 RepID=UPI001318F55E|nr:hypothetical protein [Mycoplasma sp. NEAQ87857]QGZ97910.1 hypothetical protein GE118_03820 [Mycoplasma sp. NEAQ87857]